MNNYNLKPVSKEKYRIIKTKVPEELVGKLYLRNGSNPYLKNVDNHLFDGDGMIHSIEFKKDKIIYHNKWIETFRFKMEKKYNKPLFTRLANLNLWRIFNDYLNTFQLPQNQGDGTANTSIVYYNKKLLALNEMDKPYLLSFNNGQLYTEGRYDFFGKLNNNINAHPKIDPETHEMITLGYDVYKKQCYINFIKEENVETVSVELSKSTIIHDVGITQTKVLILDLPLEFNLINIFLSKFPICVNLNYNSRIGLLDRKTKNLEWITLPNHEVIFHIANSWETECNIIIYAICYDPNTFDIESLEKMRPVLKKITIDKITQDCKIYIVSKNYGEMPVIDNKYVGKNVDYIYYSKISNNGFDAIVKHDTKLNKEQIVYFPKDMYGGESAIHENYILNIVYSTVNKSSSLLIYDKNTLELLYNVDLKCRIPFGFHGQVIDLF